MLRTYSILNILLAITLLTGCDDENSVGTANQMSTYQVTIENMTDGQPFSPGVIVTHTPDFTLWAEGQRSSPLIRRIAEDGFPLPTLVNKVLGSEPDIDQVVQFHNPMMPIGANIPDNLGPPRPPTSDTFQITADANATRISIVTMIICTNDGFTGVNSVKLPQSDDPVVVKTKAYDAGSEQNTEKFGDIVDGCTLAGPIRIKPDGNRDDQIPEEDRIIKEHPGIKGNGDLDPELNGWEGTVAQITIQRISVSAN